VTGRLGTPVVACATTDCSSDFNLQTLGAALLGDVGLPSQTQFFNATGTRTATDFRKFVQHEYGAFVQDVWKILPNLTLQLGLRYAFNGVPFEKNGNLSNLFVDPASPAPLTFSTVGPGTGRNLYSNDPHNLEPRVGLAWDPSHTGKTSIRMGYGIFHDRVFGNLFTNLKSNPPFVGAVNNFVEGPVTGLAAPSTLPSPSATVQDQDFVSVVLFDPNLRMPYTQAWNAGIQQQLGRGMTLEVNYVGSGSHRLIRVVDGNPPQPSLVNFYLSQGFSPSDLSGAGLALGPAAGLPQVTGNLALLTPALNKSIGNSTYNALQTVFNKQLGFGLPLQAAYTWSHAIDDAPDPIVTTAGSRVFPRNSFNLREERGNSEFDLRQRLVMNYTYDLPFGPGRPFLNQGLAAKIIGGWSLSGISSFQSGIPFDIYSPRDSEHTGFSNRPDVVGDTSIPSDAPRTQTGPSFSAFALQPYGRPGTLGRNSFVGPKYFNTDVDLLKNFQFTERINVQFRAEFYNIFNQLQFGQPGNLIADPGTFGLSTSELTRSDATTAARQIQLGLKVSF
jgi:hypothetical protein